MFLILCTFISALYLAGIAAWFSIEGIMAIFSGLPISALCMGVGIEAAKIVSVSWLYRNWDNSTRKLKYSALLCTLVALLLTSMGIFGYLSKAHLEQNAPKDGIESELQMIQYKIDREKSKINDNNIVLKQLDETVATLIKNEKISSKNGAREVRESQKKEREHLNDQIEESMKKVDTLTEEKLKLESNIKSIELEVGPIKYIASAIYGESENNLEKAVRIVILLIMVAFDPFAIILLMCANHSIMLRQEERKIKLPETVPSLNVQQPETVYAPINEDLKIPDISVQQYEYIDSEPTLKLEEEIYEHNSTPYDIIANASSRAEYVPVKSTQDKESRLQAIKEKLKRGEIGWINIGNRKENGKE